MSEGFAQIRPQGGGCPYAPFRDLVNCFPQIARRAAYLLAPDSREPEFDKFLTNNRVDDGDLVNCAQCLAQYINHSLDPEVTEPLEALERSGFNNLPQAAQIAILARVGQVTMAMFYACVRDAMRPDEKPAGFDQFVQELAKISALFKAKYGG